MPLVTIQTSVCMDAEAQARLLAKASAIVAEEIGKPEQYVMATLSQGGVLMGGKDGPAAFADVRSIGGLSGSVNGKISERLCEALGEVLSIPPDRVYINFSDVPAGRWGWNGGTFG